jgi:hypothetical protein
MDVSSTPSTTTSTRYYQVSSGHFSFPLAILFLVLTSILVISWIIYELLWKPAVPAPICAVSTDCGPNQVCQAERCQEAVCANDSDCENGLCVAKRCVAYRCEISNDCPTGTACLEGSCIKIGTTCKSNSDCQNLSCVNGSCVQCTADTHCPGEQGCFANVCRYPYAGQTGNNLINYPSQAQANGVIAAPPGYFCPTSDCGTTGGTAMSCLGTQACPSSCGYCVNSVCRCASGKLTEQCRANTDCESGLCRNNVCVAGGGECTTNYNGNSSFVPLGSCPLANPYCVNGTCQAASLGAACGASGMPADLCNNLQALGIAGQTGFSPDGMGFYCVNGFCQERPGDLNDQCVAGSCATVQGTAFTCAAVSTPSIAQQRCVRS